jgi:AhpD family alkylhydroperoxidase
MTGAPCHVSPRRRVYRAGPDDDPEDDMETRLDNPALLVPGALQAFQRLGAAVRRSGLPASTISLVEARASQINGCSVCLDMHSRELKATGEPDERIFMVAAWREAPYYTDAERAAMALTEAATRLADRPDAVSDELWDEAARHYDESQLAGLVLAIAVINAFNRVNATTRQLTGAWVEQYIETAPASQAA